jgi:hypothetical protein
MLTMNYDATWRKFRKLVQQQFTESMCEQEHIKLQNAEAVQMMRDFVTEPENYMLHPRRFSNSIVMCICTLDHNGMKLGSDLLTNEHSVWLPHADCSDIAHEETLCYADPVSGCHRVWCHASRRFLSFFEVHT